MLRLSVAVQVFSPPTPQLVLVAQLQLLPQTLAIAQSLTQMDWPGVGVEAD